MPRAGGRGDAGAGSPGAGAAAAVADTAGAPSSGGRGRTPLDALTTRASMPGRITRNGKHILGSAAMSGVRRAAGIEVAPPGRCTTQEAVDPEPEDSTKPRP